MGWCDGSKMLISGSSKEVCVWDATSGKLLRTIADDGGAVSADGRLVASRGQSAIRIRQTDGQLLRTILSLRDKQYAAISPEGHYRGSPDVEKEFVYVALTGSGEQVTLTPEEFSKRYGWKNDGSKVQSTTETTAARKGKPEPKAEAAKAREAIPAK